VPSGPCPYCGGYVFVELGSSRQCKSLISHGQNVPDGKGGWYQSSFQASCDRVYDTPAPPMSDTQARYLQQQIRERESEARIEAKRQAEVPANAWEREGLSFDDYYKRRRFRDRTRMAIGLVLAAVPTAGLLAFIAVPKVAEQRGLRSCEPPLREIAGPYSPSEVLRLSLPNRCTFETGQWASAYIVATVIVFCVVGSILAALYRDWDKGPPDWACGLVGFAAGMLVFAVPVTLIWRATVNDGDPSTFYLATIASMAGFGFLGRVIGKAITAALNRSRLAAQEASVKGGATSTAGAGVAAIAVTGATAIGATVGLAVAVLLAVLVVYAVLIVLAIYAAVVLLTVGAGIGVVGLAVWAAD
jgi:hypothetical protein